MFEHFDVSRILETWKFSLLLLERLNLDLLNGRSCSNHWDVAKRLNNWNDRNRLRLHMSDAVEPLERRFVFEKPSPTRGIGVATWEPDRRIIGCPGSTAIPGLALMS
jgi:hypothetical protein